MREVDYTIPLAILCGFGGFVCVQMFRIGYCLQAIVNELRLVRIDLRGISVIKQGDGEKKGKR